MTIKNILRLTAAAALFPGMLWAEQGVSDTEIKFAQVAALDGAAGALGTGIRSGILAAFEEANANGGVHGRQIALESFDDRYEPDLSVEHLTKVIQSNDFLGLVGPVGTPTSAATQPIATEAEMPFIGPMTGAGFLRNADLGNIFNVRATYHAEVEAWMQYLVDQEGMKNIALLYQDDGFGRVGLDAVNVALEKRGMEVSATGTYTRNTVAVKKALLTIKKAKPDAVVMVGAYKPVAEFIKLSKKLKFSPTFVNISFVGSAALSAELGESGENVIVSQVVPFPWDDSIEVVAQYQAALQDAFPGEEPGFVSLEGYLTGRLTIEALKAAGKDLDRASFLKALSDLRDVEVGGLNMSFGPNDNQGLDSVFLTRITKSGTFEPVAIGGNS